MRLDLELEADRLGHQFDQLLEQERVLRRRLVPRSHGCSADRISSAVLWCAQPSRVVPEREQGIVQQDQPTVGGQADVGLEALNRTGRACAKRGRRGVRTVVATEPVGI